MGSPSNSSLKLPRHPAPVKGLVPVVFPTAGEAPLATITFRAEHKHFLWLYTLHLKTRVNGLVVFYNFSQEDMVKEIELRFKYELGQRVQVGTFTHQIIHRRRWDFQAGEPLYGIGPPLSDRMWWMKESEVDRRIQAHQDGQGAEVILTHHANY